MRKLAGGLLIGLMGVALFFTVGLAQQRSLVLQGEMADQEAAAIEATLDSFEAATGTR